MSEVDNLAGLVERVERYAGAWRKWRDEFNVSSGELATTKVSLPGSVLIETADALASLSARVEAAEMERDDAKLDFAHAMQEFSIRNDELATAEADKARLVAVVEGVLRGTQSVLLDAELKEQPIDRDVVHQIDKDLRAALSPTDAVGEMTAAEMREACAKLAEGFGIHAHVARDMKSGRFPNRSSFVEALTEAIRAPPLKNGEG